MPAGGYYFDAIIRQPPIDETHLNYEDNTEEFTPISADELAYLGHEARAAAHGNRQGHRG